MISRPFIALAALVAFLIASRAAEPLSAAEEKLQVVATLPTLEALAREVGGDQVEAVSLAKGDQDPHAVSPTPVLMQKTRRADLFIEVGLALEPWAEPVVAGSGNPRIARGSPGRVSAGEGIPVLEVPAVLSREMGDVHPQGNPHLWLCPVRAKRMAARIARGLEAVRPAAAEGFRARLRSFEERIDRAFYGEELLRKLGSRTLDRLVLEGKLFPFLQSNHSGGKPLLESLGGWLARGAPLRGAKAIEYHKVWAYFARAFGLELRGSIEERPGIPPGPQHLAATIKKLREESIRLVLVDNFYDPELPRRVAEDGGARAVLLPNQVRGEPGVETYFQLIDDILDRMLAAAGEGRAGN